MLLYEEWEDRKEKSSQPYTQRRFAQDLKEEIGELGPSQASISKYIKWYDLCMNYGGLECLTLAPSLILDNLGSIIKTLEGRGSNPLIRDLWKQAPRGATDSLQL